jgi:hypothetical protein
MECLVSSRTLSGRETNTKEVAQGSSAGSHLCGRNETLQSVRGQDRMVMRLDIPVMRSLGMPTAWCWGIGLCEHTWVLDCLLKMLVNFTCSAGSRQLHRRTDRLSHVTDRQQSGPVHIL